MDNKLLTLTNFFEFVETTEEHDGYFISVPQVITIVILGTLCGLDSLKKIHQWAEHESTQEFLKGHFDIERIPCYYWMTVLMGIVKPESLNRCFIDWAQSLVDGDGHVVSFDGKAIRSANKIGEKKPLHIVSAHIGNLKLTLGQKAVGDKSNEIPAVQELIGMLELTGCLVVADALNCQKETAKAAIDAGADYLLNAKDNQKELKEEIEDYVQDPVLREGMDTASTLEKNRGRIEERTAYTATQIDWMSQKDGWEGLSSIGAIMRRTTEKDKTTVEWHYFISSRELAAEELLDYARLEWSVESMHWMLDVHFREDHCRIADRQVKKTMNILRKAALNTVRTYKESIESKRPMNHFMFDCLMDNRNILKMLDALK